MTTQLFLTAAASPLGGSGQLAALTVRGGTSTAAVTDTVASGTDIQVTAATGGATPLSWWYQVGAATSFTANVTANIRGKESNAANNAGAGILIEHYDSTGTSNLGTILTDRTVPATITEYTTTDAAKALASVAMTSTTFSDGDWIKITLKVRNVGTMGAATSGVTNTYSGPTSGSAGDTWVTFSSTLPTPATPLRDATSAASTTTGFTSTLAQLSFTHGVGAGPQNVATVAVIYGASTDNGTAAVTYGGVSMTAVGPVVHTDNATAGWVQLFKLISGVPQGNQTVVISVTGTGLSASSLIGFSGTWIGASDISATNYTSAFGAGALGTIVGTSAAGDGVFAVMAAGNTLTGITARQEQLTNVNTSSGAGNAAMASGPGYANPVTYASQISASDIWAMIFADVIAGSSNVTVTGVTATSTSVAPTGVVEGDATLTGLTATATSTAPVGTVSAGDSIVGATATSTSIAPAGTVSAGVVLTGLTATSTSVAPVGAVGVSITVTGLTASTASTAPAGSVDAGASVTGVIALTASAAPAGVVDAGATLTGITATSTSVAAAGSVSAGAALTGVTAASVSVAPAGAVGQNVVVSGLTATSTSAAPAGTVHASAALTGVTGTSTSVAPVGVVSAGATVIGVVATGTSLAPAGSVHAAATLQGLVAQANSVALAGLVASGVTVVGVTATSTSVAVPGVVGGLLEDIIITIGEISGSPITLSDISGSPVTLGAFSGSPVTLTTFSGSPVTVGEFSGSPLTVGAFQD